MIALALLLLVMSSGLFVMVHAPRRRPPGQGAPIALAAAELLARRVYQRCLAVMMGSLGLVTYLVFPRFYDMNPTWLSIVGVVAGVATLVISFARWQSTRPVLALLCAPTPVLAELQDCWLVVSAPDGRKLELRVSARAIAYMRQRAITMSVVNR